MTSVNDESMENEESQMVLAAQVVRKDFETREFVQVGGPRHTTEGGVLKMITHAQTNTHANTHVPTYARTSTLALTLKP